MSGAGASAARTADWRPLPTDTTGEWATGELPLERYLRSIKVDVPPGTPADTNLLASVVQAHLRAYAFEAVDPFIGFTPRLSLADIGRKVLSRRRAGYCFEQNLLMAAVLEALGFGVTRLGGRMRIGTTRPRGKHMALAVTTDARQSWLVDIGYGGDGPTTPVPWEDGAEVVANGWTHRLGQVDEREWVVTLKLPAGGWFDLYALDVAPQHHIDYDITNFFIGSHPRSPFTQHLVVEQRRGDRKVALRDLSLVESDARGERTETAVELDALPATLAERFGLELTPDESAAVLSRLAPDQ